MGPAIVNWATLGPPLRNVLVFFQVTSLFPQKSVKNRPNYCNEESCGSLGYICTAEKIKAAAVDLPGLELVGPEKTANSK